jgi:hypothetical protein
VNDTIIIPFKIILLFGGVGQILYFSNTATDSQTALLIGTKAFVEEVGGFDKE